MRPPILQIAFVLISWIIFGTSVNAQKAASEVKGLLWNAACKSGIPDAQIVLSNGDKKYKTKSDRSGKYLLQKVRSGDYQITIKRYGFLTIVQEAIRIVESEVRTLNYEMQPGFDPGDKPNSRNSNPCEYSQKD